MKQSKIYAIFSNGYSIPAPPLNTIIRRVYEDFIKMTCFVCLSILPLNGVHVVRCLVVISWINISSTNKRRCEISPFLNLWEQASLKLYITRPPSYLTFWSWIQDSGFQDGIHDFHTTARCNSFLPILINQRLGHISATVLSWQCLDTYSLPRRNRNR